MMVNTAGVIVIGGGPAGLAAASRLRQHGVDRVVVLEREETPGGIPRHCDHPSFGLKDMGRPMTGPRYAAAMVRTASKRSVIVRTGVTVIELGREHVPYLVSTSPQGLERWEAGAVILATGCRERPRSARLLPGSRAPGVFTTGELQQFTYLHDVKVGSRAVVVGAEHVSFSAVMTLRDAGIECVGVLTPHRRHQSYEALRLWATRLGKTPLLTGHRISSIEGHGRVEAVMAETSERLVRIPCDTVVLTGEWVAEGALAISAGLSRDVRNGGRPEVSEGGATAIDGVFAAGSVIRPGESASNATRSGVIVVDAVMRYLRRDPQIPDDLALDWSTPIRWISPQRASRTASGPVRLRVDQWVERPTVVFRSDGEVLDTVSLRRMVPGRTYSFDGSWMGRLGESTRRVQVSIGLES